MSAVLYVLCAWLSWIYPPVDSDFSSTTMVLTFPPNISKQCANVAIIDDDVIENNETLEVTLSTTDLAVIVEPHNTVITIIDDDCMQTCMK